jgi:hypothetical protein
MLLRQFVQKDKLLFKVEENVPWGEDTLFTLEFRNFARTGS